MIFQSSYPFDCISISHGFLLGSAKFSVIDDLSTQFIKSWYSSLFSHLSLFNHLIIALNRLHYKDNNNNNNNTDNNSNLSLILNSFRYYSDIHHVASSIISALKLQTHLKTQSNLLQVNCFRSRYICSTVDVLSPQFIANCLSQIHKHNDLFLGEKMENEENEYIPTMDIHPVSKLFNDLINLILFLNYLCS